MPGHARGCVVIQQVLIQLLLVVEAVYFHQTIEVLHEHARHLNLEYADTFLGIVLGFPGPLFLLLHRLCRRLLLYLDHALPLFRGPVYPAMSVVGSGALQSGAPRNRIRRWRGDW